MPLLIGCRPCPGVRICATSPVAAAAATAAAAASSRLLRLTRRARSHHPPLQFSPPGTHHPLLPTSNQRRVFTALSPSRAFSDRIHRSLHPNSSSSSSSCSLSRPRPTTSSLPPPLLSQQQPLNMGQQHRGHSHGGHGHGHHHHHDNIYLTSQNKNDAGVRITRIGLYSNLGMAIAKGAGGYLFNSQSMIADAWHSLTDLASDVLTLATVSWSLKPPTDNFPLGFGKVESLGSLGTLWAHFFLDPAAAAEMLSHGHGHGHGHHHGHGHGHGGGGGAPSLHAAWLAAGTVAVKEWLYHASMFFCFFPPISLTY
ncbi:hypothetical protein B0T21DRAFT_357284 [Apiosordaria backusii]|uniref:Cation efflux protein transmembrane domain-containing protein n=1 Tax=Apiosordaria backusii TaxID=314023 RepID=A0AA40F0F6_9PEZI|nr:hypothetical protein B0T21DRAFT_357284 [Apiosordaria backusii]